MLRAWKAHDRFEGRATMRTWLHRVVTNVCVDMLRSRQHRARPSSDRRKGPKSPSTVASAGIGCVLSDASDLGVNMAHGQCLPRSSVGNAGFEPATFSL